MFPVSVPACDFSLPHYRDILFRSILTGYRFYTHYEYVLLGQDVKEPFILLRHDIDLSLKHALPLLKIEEEFGIRSSIFIRIHASGYNSFDIDNYAILDHIKRAGFEIALHYEPLFMLLTGEDPLKQLERDKRILEAIIDEPVHGLISHAPKLSSLLKNIDKYTLASLGFVYNGADSQFVKDNVYLSDANRRWRNGCACRHIGNSPRITLLIHPCWWRPMSQDERYQVIDYLRQGK